MVKLRKHHRIAKPGNVGSHLGSVSNLLVYLLWALVYSFVEPKCPLWGSTNCGFHWGSVSDQCLLTTCISVKIIVQTQVFFCR